MKAIILNDFAYVNGGAGQIAIDTALMLAASGINTCLFTAVGPVDDQIKNINNLRIVCLNQYDILHDPHRFRAVFQGVWNRLAEKRFAKLLEEYDVNSTIIHVHSYQKALSSSCVYRAKRMGFKVIYHMHDYGIACPNLGFYNYRSQEVCKKHAMSIGCFLSNCDSRHYTHKIWRCVRQLVQNGVGKIPKGMDGYIAVSAFSYEILRPYLMHDHRVSVIPNPCSMPAAKRIPVDKNSFFVFVGRLAPEKNPVLLARCAKKLGVPVLFIGEGEERGRIQEENPDAVLCGWIPRSQLYLKIQNARCLVFPSVCYETQGLVVPEMAAYGIPSIVSDVTAASEYIRQGDNGLIFENKNECSLTNCMERVLDDSYVEMLGRNAYSTFCNADDGKTRYKENLLSFYERVLRQ